MMHEKEKECPCPKSHSGNHTHLSLLKKRIIRFSFADKATHKVFVVVVILILGTSTAVDLQKPQL